MKETEFSEERTCEACGKAMYVLRPDMWRYKRFIGNRTRYFCSWLCFRADETGGRKDMKKLTIENKKKAVEIAMAGGNPNEYLKACGVANPSASWNYIRKCLMEKDPEKYEQLMKAVKTEEDPSPSSRSAQEDRPAQAEVKTVDQVPEVTIDGAIRMKTAEPEKVELAYDQGIAEEYRREQEAKAAEDTRKISAALKFDGMTVREVEGEYGRYRLTEEYGSKCIAYESIEDDKISMRPWEWAAFMKEMKKAAAILEVSVDEA